LCFGLLPGKYLHVQPFNIIGVALPSIELFSVLSVRFPVFWGFKSSGAFNRPCKLLLPWPMAVAPTVTSKLIINWFDIKILVTSHAASVLHRWLAVESPSWPWNKMTISSDSHNTKFKVLNELTRDRAQTAQSYSIRINIIREPRAMAHAVGWFFHQVQYGDANFPILPFVTQPEVYHKKIGSAKYQ
jgi:hypothetical protein